MHTGRPIARTPNLPRSASRRLILTAGLSVLLFLATAPEARAFCGFYVGKADATLYNNASQVAIARSGMRTVISMMNDYKGALNEFALVVPVPVVLEKGQIHVGDKSLFDRLDAYSAPRLVEYFDPDPCRVALMKESLKSMGYIGAAPRAEAARDRSLGVTIEARYTVGEYDIVILLQPYIRQQMKFFVARVDLKEQAKTGVTYLRPLQFAFETQKFMLPIRLGMANARGAQDLIVYLLTRNGRVETTNYRTVMLPTGMEIPEYVKERFTSFYKSMFGRQVDREDGRAVFTEYVWNMGWCDPCAADPLTADELRRLGVFWLNDGGAQPRAGWGGSGPIPVTLTRLHVRYTAETFPEDLAFQETQDQQNFQGRYVLRHPWKGDPGQCPAASAYLAEVRERQERQAGSLASLTGWDVDEIRASMKIEPSQSWWETIWK